MGPRLFRRGNVPVSFDPQLPYWQLQWGHVFSDVEIVKMTWVAVGDAKLQWGHVFSDVEI